MSWWDGPDRYKNLNRNLVSVIQSDALFSIAKGLCSRNQEHAGFGIDIGGSGGPEMYCFGLDVVQSEAHNAIVGDGSFLPFQDNSLDYILSIASIEHIEGDPTAIFQEWVRALRIGGLIVCFAPLIEHFAHCNSLEKRIELKAPNEHTLDEWRKIVDNVHNVRIVQFNALPSNLYVDIVLLKERTSK